MGIQNEKTVAEIALERPQAAAAFEKLGIDYCCGGGKALATACEAAGIDVNHVEDLLDETGNHAPEAENWSQRSLAGLIGHIVEKHHTYCREEGDRLQQLLTKVVSKHGGRHPELAKVQ